MTRTFRLERIEDLRELDLDSGKRLPLSAGEGHECDRCGREHAVVWHVRETTPGRPGLFKVGSRCGPKLLDGWSPDKAALRKARRACRVRAERAAWSARIAGAADAARAALGQIPLLERRPNPWNGDLELIGVEGYPSVVEAVERGAPITDAVRARLAAKLAVHAALTAGYGHREAARGAAVARGSTVEDELQRMGLSAPEAA